MRSTIQEKVTARLPAERVNEIPIEANVQIFQTGRRPFTVGFLLVTMAHDIVFAGVSISAVCFAYLLRGVGVVMSLRNHESTCGGRLAGGHDLEKRTKGGGYLLVLGNQLCAHRNPQNTFARYILSLDP